MPHKPFLNPENEKKTSAHPMALSGAVVPRLRTADREGGPHVLPLDLFNFNQSRVRNG